VRAIIGGAHPLEKPRPVSRMQAYVACNSRLKLLTLRPQMYRVVYSQFADFEAQTHIACKPRLWLLTLRPEPYHVVNGYTPPSFTLTHENLWGREVLLRCC